MGIAYGIVPFLGAVVAAARPHECNELDLMVRIQIVDKVV